MGTACEIRATLSDHRTGWRDLRQAIPRDGTGIPIRSAFATAAVSFVARVKVVNIADCTN